MQLRIALLSVLVVALCSFAPETPAQTGAKKTFAGTSCASSDCAAPSGYANPPLLISEFRTAGPGGGSDEFIEIYNNSDVPQIVTAFAGSGLGVASSDGVTRCTIPNGTEIPARGHYLCVNATGYTLTAYPGFNPGSVTVGDSTYTLEVPPASGLAIFNNNLGTTVHYSLANRIDAVGPSDEVDPIYREGSGYDPGPLFSGTLNHSIRRLSVGLLAASNSTPTRPSSGALQDSDSNSVDFYAVDTNGSYFGSTLGQRLGAPGPENLSSPVSAGDQPVKDWLDECADAGQGPNKIRDLTAGSSNTSTFGTVEVRRRFTNTGASPMTRLRFRILKLTTFPASAGFADLRPISSSDVVATVDRSPCGVGTSNVTVAGTTVEEPPAQTYGGGWNSTFSVDSISLGTPLSPGASVDVRFVFGIQQTGNYRIALIAEGLPYGGSLWMTQGHTEGDPAGLNDQDNLSGTTAADVSISGRVMVAGNRGLNGAAVIMTDATGRAWTATTSTFGNFRFDGVPAGGSYVVAVRSKRYSFAPQIVSSADSVADLTFIAQ